MKWHILYRGPLSSCNYDCSYCPFAKTTNTKKELAIDKENLQKFVAWVKNRKETFELLFAPWGEALVRKYYREALIELSYFENVQKITIQTNLSCATSWLKKINVKTFSLWTTFHPTQISIDKFAKKSLELNKLGIRHSVGFVAIKEELETLEKLRKLISSETYIWANAYKREENYYSENDIERIIKVDPLFKLNNKNYRSLDEKCSAGFTSFSVDGSGNITRCNFIKNKIGNIYDLGFEKSLKPRLCSIQNCKCYIGYIHLEKLNLKKVYQGVFERIPS